MDEKTKIQELDRTQPMPPIELDASEKRTHNYRRHVTTNFFTALKWLAGDCIGSMPAATKVTPQEVEQDLDIFDFDVPLLFVEALEAAVSGFVGEQSVRGGHRAQAGNRVRASFRLPPLIPVDASLRMNVSA